MSQVSISLTKSRFYEVYEKPGKKPILSFCKDTWRTYYVLDTANIKLTKTHNHLVPQGKVI